MNTYRPNKIPITGNNLPEGALIEVVRHGNWVKASAIDPVSGIEVSVVGGTKMPIAMLQKQAVIKLKRQMFLRQNHDKKDTTNNKAAANIAPSGWEL